MADLSSTSPVPPEVSTTSPGEHGDQAVIVAEEKKSVVATMADLSLNNPNLPVKPTTEPDDNDGDPTDATSGNGIIVAYLLKNVPVYGELDVLRRKGWASEAADAAWAEQKHRADNVSNTSSGQMYKMMKNNARELQINTQGFTIAREHTDENPHTIVDFCMAPGGFLHQAFTVNPKAVALAFTLPISDGGHRVEFRDVDVSFQYVDMNLLAEDMGVDLKEIPHEHPEFGQFRPAVFTDGKRSIDLAICGGAVVPRLHKRPSYRELREAHRLSFVQLALGLGHLKDGGTMIILQHKVEALRSVRLMHLFSKFSTVKLYKPTVGHNARSSYYMIASDIRVHHEDAIQAVERWKKSWRAATFGTDEEYQETVKGGKAAQELLDEFGDTLVELGLDVWRTQRDGLASKPWTK